MFDIKRGIDVLRHYVKNAPDSPGVYRMLNDNDEVLYVGKAKSIKKRIVSYTQVEKLSTRLQKMVAEVCKMEFIIVENENRALIVENELIKKFHPKYNILLKDDKSYPYLTINPKEQYPTLRKFRGAKNKNNKYFGPYANVTVVNEVIEVIQKVFMLRSCRDSVFQNRTRPCMLWQIKRCCAPCVNKVTKEEYQEVVADVIAFLEGKSSSIQEKLSQKMQQASQQENFEKAITLRDKIKALTGAQSHANLEYSNIISADIFAIYNQDNNFCIEVFFIRNGQNCGNSSHFVMHKNDITAVEVLEAFLSNFYVNNLPPKEIFISEEIENIEFLEDAIGVKIKSSKRGDKYKIIDSVKKNAKASLERKLQECKSIKDNLKEMVEYFELNQMPKRIEVYDNSHNQGSYAVGAMIVATPEGFDKKSYRTFNIKDAEITNDDFAMMKEVLKRRFDKMTEENRPDIILLDGGIGQLHAVCEALRDYDTSNINIIAISKGVDRNAGKEFYHQIGKKSFVLPYRSSVAFYLQKIRDEAHRFAIGTHRKKRQKALVKSRIDDIEGIGVKKKRDLLNYFGSIDEIKSANIDDIIKVQGINKKTAEKIYNYFHK